jgi:hypothetical protein
MVERICKLPDGYFDEGEEVQASSDTKEGSARESLFAFLETERAKEIAPTPAEIIGLSEQRFAAGEVPGDDYWYYTLLAWRARPSNRPSERPNLAAGEASQAGLKRKMSRKPPAPRKQR